MGIKFSKISSLILQGNFIKTKHSNPSIIFLQIKSYFEI